MRVELLKGGAVNTVMFISTENDGTLDWDIPPTQMVGADYSVRVISTSNEAISDTSDAYFTINPSSTGSITVTAPNGGETWMPGTIYAISWASTGTIGTYVRIELLKSGVLNRVIASSSLNDGEQKWLIPTTQIQGSDYKIRVNSRTYPLITDTSDFYLTIGTTPANTITVTSPNGGESWLQGSIQAVTWTTSAGRRGHT